MGRPHTRKTGNNTIAIKIRSPKTWPSADGCWDKNDAGSVGSHHNYSHPPSQAEKYGGRWDTYQQAGATNNGKAVGHREEGGGDRDAGDSENDREKTISCPWMAPSLALMTRG